MKNHSFSIVVLSLFSLLSCSEQSEVKNDNNTISGKQHVENPNFIATITKNARLITSDFEIPEVMVKTSPDIPSSIDFEIDEKITDYDVSPKGEIVAILINKKNRNYIKYWKIGENEFFDEKKLPENYSFSSITWHPLGSKLFLIATNQKYNIVTSLETESNDAQLDTIYKSEKNLRRLVVGPRPFITSYTKDHQAVSEYRLFIGMANDDNSFRITSITEDGKSEYQVIGKDEAKVNVTDFYFDYYGSPRLDWALPLAFHPAGHELIIQNKNNDFLVIQYDRGWHSPSSLNIKAKGGTLTPTPNGLGFIHWQKEVKGIGICLLTSKKEERQLTEYTFLSTPSSVPDGKGIIGLTKNGNSYSLEYQLIQVPLADVCNAWMFADSEEEISKLATYQGLFRPNQFDQLYKLYETENYHCEGYDWNYPNRPYMVTTDIFWEIFGAAYQGLFISREKDIAIPSFWNMIDLGYQYYSKNNSTSKWKIVFTALHELKRRESDNVESNNILDETDKKSEYLKMDVKYSILKPRGHYTANDTVKQYFRAFKYFTTIFKEDEQLMNELNTLPPNFQQEVKKWIDAYTGFIAPSNEKLVFNTIPNTKPIYTQYESPEKCIFPLSWGIDNEIFNSTIYHNTFPEDKQIKNATEERLLPSGIDLASALGSTFAKNLLKNDLEKFPKLNKVIHNLNNIYNDTKGQKDFTQNIYNTWMNAIATQWSDDIYPLNNDSIQQLWKTKRLQTGLATWATLRHATVLVNSTGAAECGEGGFEELLMRTPRGYVEPDPKTFYAIADLFDKAKEYTSSLVNSNLSIDRKEMYKGISERLTEAANDAREFAKMAEKEIAGENLTNDENEKILGVARVAEHLYLLFNSISNNFLGLADPEPIAKICDVAGGKGTPYLLVGVGNSIEWDHVVPFYGRKQIVKGSIYSYYEFSSSSILNDQEWRKQVDKKEFLPWIKPFITTEKAFGVANSLYLKQ